MIKIYFTRNDQVWSDEHLRQMLNPQPAALQIKALAYKGWQERQSRILGKWLLMKVVGSLHLSYTLHDLKYTNFNKPYFAPSGTGTFDFSIAHSHDIVLCACSTVGQIGADIDLTSPRDLTDYQDQLTANEWRYIHQSPDQLQAFYNIWTKKEALMKAIGKGIDMDFNAMDVCGDTHSYNGKIYFFYPIPILPGYAAHIASSVPIDIQCVAIEELPCGPI